MANELLITLRIDSKGNAVISQVKSEVLGAGQAAQQAGQQASAASESYVASLGRQLVIYGLIAAAVWRTERAIVEVFKSGIRAVDEYQVAVIAIAATLTDMAKPGQGDMADIFRRNKTYAEDMYKAIVIESAKHFATANEGMTVYNRLVQSGYAARLEEVGALLLLTDKIKLATRGQEVQRQLNTEIIALMNGQAQGYSMLALELKQRLGPQWANLVQKHREAGDLLTWLMSLYPGLAAANKAIEGTINAQWATTKSLLELVAISGLAGAYQDIVGWLKEINDYLRTHEELSGRINKAWWNISGAVEGIGGFIGGATLALIEFGANLDKISQNPLLMMAAGAAFGFWRMGLSGAVVGGAGFAAGSAFLMEKERMRNFYGTGPYGEAAETFYPMPKSTGPPPEIENRAPKDATKGVEAARRKIENLIDSLQKDWSQLAEGSFSQVDAWGDHVRREIERVKGFSEEKAKAMTLLGQVETLKKEKIEQDFYSWVAKASGDHYASLTADTNRQLHAVGTNAELAAEAIQVYFDLLKKQREKDNLEILNLQKSQLEGLAAVVPLKSQQLAIEQKILPLVAEINRLSLDRKMTELGLTEAQKEELRGLQAVTEQYRKFNLEMEKNKGFAGWAWSRAKEAEEQGTVRNLMNSLESGTQNAFSSALQGFLSQDRQNLLKVGQTMFLGLWGEIQKSSISSVYGGLAKMLAPRQPAGLEGTSDRIMGQLSGAASGLQKASVGLNLNTAQFGLAAGGLLLSGIGIATNSQALVIAGTVLQMAGMAIQLYEALTATTEITAAMALSGSAAALTGSAISLDIAAIALKSAAAASAGRGGDRKGGGLLSFIPGVGPLLSSIFHAGGLVAHQGLLVAHGGLAADERLVLAQVGEPIINRDAWRQIEGVYGPGAFQMFNSGRVPAVPVGDSRPAVNIHYAPVIHAGDSKGVEKALRAHSHVLVDIWKKAQRDFRVSG